PPAIPRSEISISLLSSASAVGVILSPRAAASAATAATPTADDPPSPAPTGKSLCTRIHASLKRNRRAAASAIERSAKYSSVATLGRLPRLTETVAYLEIARLQTKPPTSSE